MCESTFIRVACAIGVCLSMAGFGERAHAALTGVRSIDGSGNNTAVDPTWGSAGSTLLRMSPAVYPGDGSGSTIITAATRANPRDISNAIAAQGEVSVFNNRGLSDFVWQWGQFVDHDIDLTGTSAANGTADIPVGAGDILGPAPISFSRSNFAAGTGVPGTPREQVNEITAYIDASNIYGSDTGTAAALRTGVGGQLATSAGGLLLPTVGPNFISGDVRAEEQVGLTSMHTLFMREHNRLADEIAVIKPLATDEEIYQTARKIVGAQMQAITYNEFLPALLGPGAVADYAGYDDSVDAGIKNEFSTASYRFGHSMLARALQLGTNGDAGEIALRDAFFDPTILMSDPGKVDLLMEGLASQKAQEIDSKVVDDVRNFLFGPPGAGGLDLPSLNIQRGRDHGLDDYNAMRVAFGLLPKTAFFDPGDGSGITTDAALAAELDFIYSSDIDNVDAWVGGLAEDHVSGSVGELVAAVLADQFSRTRDGDRFFYLNDPDLAHPDIQATLQSLYGTGDVGRVLLSDIIEGNTGASVQANVFFVVPEPMTAGLSLLSLSALGLGLRRRRG